jgi:nucleoside-diphosphate-sugar epimerase
MSIVVVTGADGFIGSALVANLERRGHRVRRAVRSSTTVSTGDVCITGDIAQFSAWNALVRGADAVVHLAARAHITSRTEAGGVAKFRPSNVDATMRLAEACRQEDVRRLVFVSSIGVNGEGRDGKPYTEEDPPAPVEPYAYSKLEAEQGLRRVLEGARTEYVIVRPTLVYGPGVKGNLLRLLRLVNSGLPLPLGSLRAPRSFIGLENLSQLLIACIEHSDAVGQLFLAAEPEGTSTADLVEAMRRRVPGAGGIWKCPLPLLSLAARLAGKRAEFRKIAGSFEVDSSKATRVLGWRASVPFDEEMDRTVASFLRSAM